MVGRLDPSSGKIDLKHAPTQNSHPYGIAINSKGVPDFLRVLPRIRWRHQSSNMEIKEYVSGGGRQAHGHRSGDRVYFTDFSEAIWGGSI